MIEDRLIDEFKSDAFGAPQVTRTETFVHPTSFVHPRAELDVGVEVGPFSIIGPQVKVGKNTRIRSHVVIEGKTQIGHSNVIFPNAVIGAVPQDLKYKGENTAVVIGDSNTIRESVTINLGTEQGGGKTVIGNGNLLMAYVHVGHDSIVHNDAILVNYVGLAGHCEIEDFAIVAGMSGVSQFVRVGAYAYVGGQSGLERDVPPYSIALGSRPTRIKGANIVGLKRRGFKSEAISRMNEAIKLWAREDILKEQSLIDIETQYGEFEEVKHFVEFIRKSKTGVVR